MFRLTGLSFLQDLNTQPTRAGIGELMNTSCTLEGMLFGNYILETGKKLKPPHIHAHPFNEYLSLNKHTPSLK